MCRGFDPLFSLWQDRARSFWGIFSHPPTPKQSFGVLKLPILKEFDLLGPKFHFSLDLFGSNFQRPAAHPHQFSVGPSTPPAPGVSSGCAWPIGYFSNLPCDWLGPFFCPGKHFERRWGITHPHKIISEIMVTMMSRNYEGRSLCTFCREFFFIYCPDDSTHSMISCHAGSFLQDAAILDCSSSSLYSVLLIAGLHWQRLARPPSDTSLNVRSYKSPSRPTSTGCNTEA